MRIAPTSPNKKVTLLKANFTGGTTACPPHIHLFDEYQNKSLTIEPTHVRPDLFDFQKGS